MIPSTIPSHLDRVFLMVGSPGRYQFLVAFMLCCMQFPVSFSDYLLNFYRITPLHRCRAKSNLTLGDYELRPLVTVNGRREYAACELYKDPLDHSKGTKPCDAGYEFLLVNGEWTIITEWELVCERDVLASLLPYVSTVAAMIGALLTGILADRKGRKNVLLVSLLMHTSLGVILHFLPVYGLFAAIFSFQAFLIMSVQCTSYLLLIENLPTVWQWRAALAVAVFQCCGQLLLSILAWLVRHWRYIQLVISAPGVVVIGYFWLLPRSIAWLVSEDLLSSVNNQLERLSAISGLVFIPSLRLQLLKACRVARSTHGAYTTRHNLETIACSPRLRSLALVQYYIWFVLFLTAKCPVQALEVLKDNPYSQLFVQAICELSLTVLFFVVTKRVGLKVNQGMALAICGIFCVFSAIIDHQVGQMKIRSSFQRSLPQVLALLGQSIARGLTICIWMHAVKTFPTGIRCLGLGTCLFWGKASHLFIPLISEMAASSQYTVLAFCGVLNIIGALFSIWLLPDCTKRPLATIAEEVEIGRTKIIDDSDPDLLDPSSDFVPNIPASILGDSSSSASQSSGKTDATDNSLTNLLVRFASMCSARSLKFLRKSEVTKMSTIPEIQTSGVLVESNLFEPVTGFVFKWDQKEKPLRLMEFEKQVTNFWKTKYAKTDAVAISNDMNNSLKLFYHFQSQDDSNLNDTSL